MTGTRAEFGLLAPVMRAIEARPSLTLRVVAAGMHLAAGSESDITDAGFSVDARVPMQQPGATGRAADVGALGRGVSGFGEAMAKLDPDVVLVLGDRIEALAAGLAASVGGFRLAHIHGGDRAEGVADEAMRHAISKLAHLHFPATAESRDRLIRLGEDERRVFCVGSPAADALDGVESAADAPELIVMQHPIGAEPEQERTWMAATLAATANRDRLVLMPNHDPGREGIVAAIEAADAPVADHLPRPRFLGLLKGARAIVGNSSAGLIEAAVLGTPCVSIGPRQGGRERPAGVIDADYGEKSVREAVAAALELDTANLTHPYGDGHAGERIASLLAELDLAAAPLRKRNSY
ncbi:MAG: UDP-N-acetylglucosamine 2-epimerase [Phycisphaeraceae bacterium]